MPNNISKTPVFAMILLPLLFLGILHAHETKSQSCSFNKDYAYKAPNSPAVYYITENCTKRPFTRADIFFTYFRSWDNVSEAPAALLRNTPNDTLGFMPLGPLYKPQYGALVKTVKDPKVYLLLGEKKYWINSEKIFTDLAYQWNWIEDVDPRLLDKYLTGEEITDTTSHPNYTLIKYTGDPKVYRLEPGSDLSFPGDKELHGKTVKRHVADETTFNALRFRSDRIVTVRDTETYPEGAPITAREAASFNKEEDLGGSPACESNPEPIFTHPIIDPDQILNIVPPPTIRKDGSHLTTHSYIDLPNDSVPVYAPIDMRLIAGSHYVGGPYYLDFLVSCEVKLRLAHIKNPVPEIAKHFSTEPIENGPEVEVTAEVNFKAGDLIGYSTGDFGLYHSERPNRFTIDEDAKIRGSTIYTKAICPYDFFIPELREQYRAKYNLETHIALKFINPSFCK